MKKKQNKKSEKEKGKMKNASITFRPAGEIEDLLSHAKEATGASVGEIINQCVREKLSEVVQKIDEKRKAARERFLKKVSDKPSQND